MNTDAATKVAQQKLKALELAEALGNITEACRLWLLAWNATSLSTITSGPIKACLRHPGRCPFWLLENGYEVCSIHLILRLLWS